MLNIFDLKKKEIKPTMLRYKGNDVGNTRHYPPANKEWFNSIYAYNKNTTKLLPVADKVIIRLIKSYFNLYSRKLEKKIRSRRLSRKMKRLTTRRIMVSRAELKHSSDKVTITLYIYNRQKIYYLNRIKKIATLDLLNLESFKVKMKLLKTKALMVISKVRKEKDFLLKTLKLDNKSFKIYEKNYSKLYAKKSLQKEIFFLYFKQIILLNRSKFYNTYLLPLKVRMSKIYNKKVEFNFVSLKHLQLNSDIFTHILANKLRFRKNRILKVLKASMRAIALPSPNRILYLRHSKQDKLQEFKLSNLLLNNFDLKNEDSNKNVLSAINNMRYLPITKNSSNDIKDFVLNSIKHKSMSGIRIEASGRLSRRITAARSVFKFRYLGGLKNIDSSYKGLSSVLLRGHFKSNLQYTRLKSKTIIGSFGLKSFMSSI